jgi:hypothetical protein
MSRIAKADVVYALKRAQSLLVEAGGADKRISRAEKEKKLGSLDGAEKQLVDTFFRFVDHRDAKPGATITNTDLDKAVAYAADHMIANYDVNHDGLSKAEISKMSLTGRLAVQVAEGLKGSATEIADSRKFAEQFTTFNDLLDGGVKVERTKKYTSPESVPLPLQQMILDATHESTHTDAKTLAECFEAVDKNGNGDGEFVVRNLRDPKSGAKLISIDYGAGDNTYGAIFAPSGKMIAGIHDGDFEPKP